MATKQEAMHARLVELKQAVAVTVVAFNDLPTMATANMLIALGHEWAAMGCLPPAPSRPAKPKRPKASHPRGLREPGRSHD